MKKQENPKASERGSAIMWVLILIALLAALSAVVSRGTRTGETTISKEQAQLAATEVMSYLGNVKKGVDMLLIKGCDVNNIDFDTPAFVRNNDTAINSSPPGATAACSLHSPDGAGVRPIVVDSAVHPQYAVLRTSPTSPKAMHFSARYVNAELGSDENDLGYLAHGMKDEVCHALAKLASGRTVSSIPMSGYTTGSNYSYTPGTAGTLTPVVLLEGTRIFIDKMDPAYNFCSFGMIIRVN